MVYKVIGMMSGSSLDGLDIAYVHLQEQVGSSLQGPRAWGFQLLNTVTYPYSDEWRERLAGAPALSALDYQLLHVEYGHYLGAQVLRFIEAFGLDFQVQLVVSHGHTALHWPERKLTAQLGDGAAIAATTGINVVSDLRAMDMALGGQGAPIVPIGELLLLPGYDLFLNLGGIANISRHGGQGAAAGATEGAEGAEGAAGVGGGKGPGEGREKGPGDGREFVAYDVCPANRVLNALAEMQGKAYDEGGAIAASGRVDPELLRRLDALPYYQQPYPKSLANEFGTHTIVPMLQESLDFSNGRLSVADAMRTYVEHIAGQVERAVAGLGVGGRRDEAAGIGAARMLVTGGGAHNDFLVGRLRERVDAEVMVPHKELIDYKEALVMALIGVLRWREERNVLASVTGAVRDSVGGAVWIGQEV
ncbi:MAG TPA: anhydro-N-acetylmuramic acid kinase [Puia sp.]|nr:anhydro-N-acetylmuramic acid kinase [Puia sp.]